MEQDHGRVPAAPGSHPTGHAGCAVDGASRFDPSRMTEDEARICYWLVSRRACLMEMVHNESNGDRAHEIALEAIAFRHIVEGIQRGSHRGWAHIEEMIRDRDRHPEGDETPQAAQSSLAR